MNLRGVRENSKTVSGCPPGNTARGGKRAHTAGNYAGKRCWEKKGGKSDWCRISNRNLRCSLGRLRGKRAPVCERGKGVFRGRRGGGKVRGGVGRQRSWGQAANSSWDGNEGRSLLDTRESF